MQQGEFGVLESGCRLTLAQHQTANEGVKRALVPPHHILPAWVD